MTIKLNGEQLNMLEPYARENYINELFEHYNVYYPYLIKTMEEKKLKQIIRESIAKAAQRGFTQRGPVQFYLDMMVAFGVGFETDPQYPWIQQALAANVHLPQIEQSAALFVLTQNYFEQILGEQSQHFFDAAEKNLTT